MFFAVPPVRAAARAIRDRSGAWPPFASAAFASAAPICADASWKDCDAMAPAPAMPAATPATPAAYRSRSAHQGRATGHAGAPYDPLEFVRHNLDDRQHDDRAANQDQQGRSWSRQ